MQITCVLLLALVCSPAFATSEVDAQKAPNPNYFRPNLNIGRCGSKFYYLSIIETNFFKALEMCNYHGMRLATISSLIEHQCLSNYTRTAGGATTNYWIGGSDLSSTPGKWSWVTTGKRIDYNGWLHGAAPKETCKCNVVPEPERCLYLDIAYDHSARQYHRWSRKPCSTELAFICERDFKRECDN